MVGRPSTWRTKTLAAPNSLLEQSFEIGAGPRAAAEDMSTAIRTREKWWHARCDSASRLNARDATGKRELMPTGFVERMQLQFAN